LTSYSAIKMKTFFSIKATSALALTTVMLWQSSGVGIVLAQTPSASVNSGAQAARGGSLASPAVLIELPSLRPAIACGNQLSVSARQAQTTWGGMSAPASILFVANAATGRVSRKPRSLKPTRQPQKPAPEVPSKVTETTNPTNQDATIGTEESKAYEMLYESFHRTYRLGPGDELAVRVRLQPDYSIEKTKVSPDGRLFHPLTGDLAVGGLTVDQLTKRLTQDLAKYIRNPEVSVHLLEAKSAKVGVLGEVGRPGILIMSEPMTVLDAITQSGGFARTGKSNKVTLVRQARTGRMQLLSVNIKRILAGQADVEENLPLQPGDTVIVHGNFLKKLEYVTASLGFTQFLAFLTLARR
jgi:polysaccharide biosynthesis/export protein